MKKVIVVISFCFLLLVCSGCERQNAKIAAHPTDSNAVWDGNTPLQPAIPDFFPNQAKIGAFPESMVGVWKSAIPDFDWTIKFEPNGMIKKIVHSLAGPVNIESGGVEANGPDPGTYYVFAMGPCEAKYIPETRMVKIKIVVDHYVMKLPDGVLEGRTEDYFEGPVSEDGKIWRIKLWSFGWLKDAILPDINQIKENPVSLTFTKLDPNQPGFENAFQ
jgi:hypothetical protein